MTTKKVCAIILNWNLKDDTLACVRSVLANREIEILPIIVDNDSQDDSVRTFRAEFGEAVRIIVNPENYGYGIGMNVGIQYALAQTEGDLVLLLNNDTILDGDMIRELASVAISDDKIGIVSPMILYFHDQNRIWNLGDRRYTWLPFPWSVRKNKLDRGELKVPLEVDYVTGCGMLVKREVFNQIGFFDPIYVMYAEDADFCRRVRDAGYRIVCVPTAKMWHKVAASSNKDKPRNRFFRTKGQVIFYRRFRHGPHPFLTHLYVLLRSLWLGFNDLLAGNFSLLKPLLQGLWVGYREPLNQPRVDR